MLATIAYIAGENGAGFGRTVRTVSDNAGVLKMLPVAGFAERPSMALDLVAFLAGITFIALDASALLCCGVAWDVHRTCRIYSGRRFAWSCA
jgi:hypothetical protein